MHHCESASFLHLLIYHRVVYFAYLMALRDDMPLTLVVFWSNFNIHYLDSASLACLCLCLRLHVCACCQTSVFHLLLKRCFPVRTSLTATFSTHKNDNAGTQRKKKKTGDSNVKYNCWWSNIHRNTQAHTFNLDNTVLALIWCDWSWWCVWER